MKLKLPFIIHLIAIFLGIQINFAQTPDQSKKIIEKYDQAKLKQLEKQYSKTYRDKKAYALKYASEKGVEVTKTLPDGGQAELQRVLPSGELIYYRTYNTDAARSTRTDHVNTGGSTGFNLDGQNMTAHVWDYGHVRLTHDEFDGPGGENRVTAIDTLYLGVQLVHSHATHVTGTIAAAGIFENGQTKGMASHAKVNSYTWDYDLPEAISAASEGMLVSNHSYGLIGSNLPDYFFGGYTDGSRDWDELMYNSAYYTMVVAAGNDGETQYNDSPLNPAYSQFDKITWTGMSKNNIVVANAQDANVDSNGNLISVAIHPSSSQGPTDDLRIKPDIAGNGTQLVSPLAFDDTVTGTATGTSMAAPNVTGSLLLLQQHANNLYNTFLRSATLKGLALHTADDFGMVGPDAISGWGLLNTKKAAETISERGNSSIIEELELAEGETFSMTVDSDGIHDLMASISWTDPAGVTTNITNDPTPILVNDLDITITQNSSTYYPWRLTDVNANANDADNARDPYERVDIASASGTYTITVTHKGALTNGSQKFSLIVTGVTSTSLPCTSPTDFLVEAERYSATVEWDSKLSAVNYEYLLTEVVGSSNIGISSGVISSAENSLTFSDLNSDSSYVFNIRSNCGSGELGEWSIFEFQTSSCPSYASTDTPATIPESGFFNQSDPLQSVITVNRPNEQILDVNVTVNITHENIQELRFNLIAPDGTSFLLVDDFSTNGINYTNTTFDAEATVNITDGVAPFTGSFIPQTGDLTQLYGTPVSGNWTLEIIDSIDAQHTGSLDSWSIEICGFDPSSCPPPIGFTASNITTTGATLTWDNVSNASSGYQWIVMEQGVAPDVATAVVSGSVQSWQLSHNVSGLTNNTSYDAYIRSNCGTLEGISNWSALTAFTTSPYSNDNLALNGITFSSTGASHPLAVDGDLNTRWESEFSNFQWWTVDLGAIYSIGQVVIFWDEAYASRFAIQVSDDNLNFTTVTEFYFAQGGIDIINLNGTSATGRYVRFFGITPATPNGFSFREFQVYQAGSKANDASLIDLQVDGNTVADFSTALFDYNVELPGGTTALPTVTATPTQSTANAVVTPAASLPGTTNINVTAEDGVTTRTYTINFTVDRLNIAANKPATASTEVQPASSAFDEDPGTRWESASADPQWIYVDLLDTYNVTGAQLTWEGAYAEDYTIEISNDALNWVPVFTETVGDGGIDDISFSPFIGRYVRMYGTQRGTIHGYSLWEFQVYGTLYETTADFTYDETYSPNWIPGNPVGVSSPTDNIEILSGTAVIDAELLGNNLTVASGATLQLNTSASLNMSGGISNNGNMTLNGTLILDTDITGTGTITVDDGGVLDIVNAGSTAIIPTYNIGSTLRYRDITGPVECGNEWNAGTTPGAGVPYNVTIDGTTLNLSSTAAVETYTVANNLEVTSGSIDVQPHKSLHVLGDYSGGISGVEINLHSDSQNYANLIIAGESNLEDISYSRFTHVAGSGTSGDNDLIASPVSNQSVGDFAAANSNLYSVGSIIALAPFNNNTTYENYDISTDSGVLLSPGVGYRSATTDGSPLVFTGQYTEGVVTQSITVGSGNFGNWNLIGNPYTAHISAEDFLNYEVATGVKNIDLMPSSSAGLYGYNAAHNNFWEILTLANAAGRFITPGQGFFVAADGVESNAHNITFTPGMQALANTDDFIAGRAGKSALTFLKLKANTSTEFFTTDFYFNEASSKGLDHGYDAIIWGKEHGDLRLYSHLADLSSELKIGLQSLNMMHLEDVVIPLGVNGLKDQDLTFSIEQSQLPNDINVFLQDEVNGKVTLLNKESYSLTPNSDLSGTGRFYLTFTNKNTLSVGEDLSTRTLQVYVNNSKKQLIIEGDLTKQAKFFLFDIQGRLISQSALKSVRSNAVDINHLSGGLYFVKVQDQHLNQTHKIIIE